MNTRVASLVAVGLLLPALGGCTRETSEPVPAPEPVTTTQVPEYDVRAEAAAAVLPLVPETATSLAVTDLRRIRLQLGLPDLDGQAPAAARARFWARAERTAPLLTDGLLRPVDARLLADYGFGQDDVLWEARFDGPDGPGWVLSFRLGIDMGAVQRAVRDRVGVLAGAEVRAEQSLVVRGAAPDGSSSWAVDPELTAMVGPAADATYLERGCVTPPAEVDPEVLAGVGELTAYSVAFQGALATARLGEARDDAFARLRLEDAWPRTDFTAGFDDGVADPSTGRVGYQLRDPAVAAAAVRARDLPLAACAD